KGNSVWHSNKSAAENAKALKKQEAESFSADDLAGAVRNKNFPDVSPQLATLADEAFDEENWIFENKYDGYRALALIDKTVELKSRNGNKLNYQPIIDELGTLGQRVILDGEVVIEDSKGISQFQWLQDYKDNPTRGKLKFYVFDLLYFDGFDFTGLPLIQRKKILKALLPESDIIKYSPHTEKYGKKAFAKAEKQQTEGIIAKRADSKYYSGKRTRDWLKIKTGLAQEMVIVGYTAPQGSRT